MVKIECKNCFKEFPIRKCLEKIRKFCSRKCYQEGYFIVHNKESIEKQRQKLIGKRFAIKHEFKKGYTPWNKGVKVTKVTGEKNVKWQKDEELTYRNLHKRIERMLGKPSICASCGIKNLFGHQIHWANKSRKYKNKSFDWIRLCAKCHKAYDRNQSLLQFQQQPSTGQEPVEIKNQI